MSVDSFLVVSAALKQIIFTWAEKAYPHEGCGLLIGQFLPGKGKEMIRLAALTNDLLGNENNIAPTLPEHRQGKGAGKTEFLMKPDEFNRETLKAEKEGLDVIGVIHTHPDHPAIPSKIDESQPFLAQWSNIIVSVQKGKAFEMRSWFREEDNQPFAEELIRIS
ncbi:MAG: Mov34/MPN/PAD-1 family protein [Elusimicrobiota bacterium]